MQKNANMRYHLPNRKAPSAAQVWVHDSMMILDWSSHKINPPGLNQSITTYMLSSHATSLTESKPKAKVVNSEPELTTGTVLRNELP